MRKLYYIRHGESQAQVEDRWGGQNNPGLTNLGKEQATRAGRLMKEEGIRFDLIISSPLTRAYETAKLIANEVGYPSQDIDTHDSFMERTFGVLDDQPGAQAWMEKNGRHALDEIEGAETIEQLQVRARGAMAHLKSLPYDVILVVAHGSFGRALRREIEGKPHHHEYTELNRIPNATLLELL